MMSNRFDEVKEKYIKILNQYIPIVDRVHGQSHPEFHDVRRLFEEIIQKLAEAGNNRPKLSNEFERLREITDNYTVPDDVCESYEAVYNMLSEIDKAYYDN